MRSTIFISLASLALATAVQAQDGPEPGCYERNYSDSHLRAHPDQVVRSVKLRVYDDAGYRYASMRVGFADQGHVRRDGHGAQVLDQYLACFLSRDGRPGCGVECDGGSFTVTKQDASGLTFSTNYLLIGETDGCGGMIDMAEHVGQPVKYRLNRVTADQCSGM